MSMQLRGWTWFSAVSIVLGLCSMPKPVEARDVLEILKEKGVITQQEYEEAKEEAKKAAEKNESPVKWKYRFGRGFTVETKDGNNQLYIGSRFQFRHTFEARDGSDDRSSFRVRRAKLWFRGHVYRPWIKYRLQGAFDSGEDGEFEMEDYYFDIVYSKPLTLRLGQYKVPFSRQELTSSAEQQFVDRALANELFNLDYDLGSMIHGGFMDLVNYNFSVSITTGRRWMVASGLSGTIRRWMET